VLRGRRLALVPVIAVLGGLVALAAALPAAGVASTAARPGKLTVGVQVLRFNAHGRREVATGLVTARLSSGGSVHTVREKVAVIAAAGRRCQVLSLYLNQLDLTLLGLNAHLGKVDLTLTGDPRGGVLGSLFCKLAHARVASARASAARALNRDLARTPARQSFLRFSADVAPKTTSTAGGTCPVLNLVLGPLKLTLLGLDVSLNQVNLKVTATQGGGALGDLFCQLADNSTTGTTTPTTTTQTATTPTSTTPTTTTG
jgi:hypothetical protein